MIVREAKKIDHDILLPLGIEFAQVSQESHGFSISEKKISDFISTVVENSSWISLVLEDEGVIKGFLAGVINSTFFSEDIYSQEVVWYVKEFCRDGIKLLFEFEKVSKERNCKRIIVGYKPKFVDMKIIYERMDYKLMESYYVKDICQQ